MLWRRCGATRRSRRSRRQHKVHPNQVSTWKRQAIDGLSEVFSNGADHERQDHETEVRDLHAKIGQLTVERDFLARRAQAMSRGERKAMIAPDRPGLSLSRQCRLLSISRSSFYYAPRGESPENLALMRRIDELFLRCPFYGSRQMVRQLRREGISVGRHRVRRLMRLMGLEAIYQAPRTSTPHPGTASVSVGNQPTDTDAVPGVTLGGDGRLPAALKNSHGQTS